LELFYANPATLQPTLLATAGSRLQQVQQQLLLQRKPACAYFFPLFQQVFHFAIERTLLLGYKGVYPKWLKNLSAGRHLSNDIMQGQAPLYLVRG